MTGKELIICILKNDLEKEDVDTIIKKLFLNEYQLAAKFNVGVDTIRAWRSLQVIDGIKIGDSTLYCNDILDPRLNKGK